MVVFLQFVSMVFVLFLYIAIRRRISPGGDIIGKLNFFRAVRMAWFVGVIYAIQFGKGATPLRTMHALGQQWYQDHRWWLWVTVVASLPLMIIAQLGIFKCHMYRHRNNKFNRSTAGSGIPSSFKNPKDTPSESEWQRLKEEFKKELPRQTIYHALFLIMTAAFVKIWKRLKG